MILLLQIFVPLITGLIVFVMSGNMARTIALLGAITTLALSVFTIAGGNVTTYSVQWIPSLGASFSLLGDGMSNMLCLLTGIVAVVIMLAQLNKEVDKPSSFYGLLMMSFAGLMSVFLASDALLFYFGWELALIPVYFLSSRWGGERRIQVTFKFFVYTFVGSLLMLAALIYIYLHTPNKSYALQDMIATSKLLDAGTQIWLFPLMFIAFAIKMPIFPFHTWQPDAYEQSPTPVTIVLSALMVKMGLFAVLRWLLPTLPMGAAYWSNTVITLSVIGIIYASLLAMKQTDMKRLIAYSSIAHMGLMNAVAFAGNAEGIHGLLVQMFNHGINITGMWLIVQMIETRYGTKDMSKLGGMASVAPRITIAFVIIAFANIALPLTNGFVGEFMLFYGLFNSASAYHIVFMVLAGLGIILGAVYTLTMVQKVAYGNSVVANSEVRDLSMNEWMGIAIIIAIILLLGVYPQPILALTAGFGM